MQVSARWLATALVVVGSARIYSTYKIFNHTVDEPAHIACGLEWLTKHRYEMEPQHPPLARAMAAFGPWLVKCRLSGQGDMYRQGETALFENGRYNRNLLVARVGILPFFWLACAAVFVWAKRHFGAGVAAASVAIFTMVPPVLGHAGLATTDMAAAATLVTVFVALLLWLESPGWRRAALLGLCGAVAVLAKLSNLVLFPAAALPAITALAVAGRIPRGATAHRVGQLALAVAILLLVVWAGYFFSYGQERTHGWWVPAPELFNGVHDVREHNRVGHPSFLLGQWSMHGFWYYYPAVLALKTPIALLALMLAGTVICIERRSDALYLAPILFAAGILAAASFSNINIGVRHILAIYAAGSVIAGVGAAALWHRGRWWRISAGLAMATLVATSAASHPDYLAYTNAAAGKRPENALADSDLDWGQDMKRLRARLRELHVETVTFDPFVSVPLDVKVVSDNPDRPEPGYHAVSVTTLRVGRMGLWQTDPRRPLWPDRYKPRERVGKGILLYYIPTPRAAAVLR